MSNNLLRGLATAWILLIAAAASTVAQDKLSKSDKEWMEKDVSAIITQEEIEIFQNIDKDDRKLFKELFWLRRDYNPGTEANEYRDGYEERMKVANDAFKERGRKGFETEMGQVFLLMGSPDEQQRGAVAGEGGLPEIPPAPEADRGGEGTVAPRIPGAAGARSDEETMLWVYHPNEPLGIPQGLAVEFRQREQFGFRVANRDDVGPYFDSIKDRMIADPRINYARNEEGRLLTVDELSPGKVLLAELRNTGVTSSAITFTVTPNYFLASDERVYIPIAFAISDGASSGNLTFFQTVVGANGFQGEIVERPERLTKDGSGQYRYEYPIQLEPGSYKLYVGFLDAASEAHGSQIIDLDVPDLEGDALKLSSILMFEAAEPTDQVNGTPGAAFVLAGHHFKPKASLSYKHSDYLSGVFNAYNYGLDGGQPNLTVQVSFSKDGEPRGQTQESPFAAQAAQMALATFDIPLNIPNFNEPGDYTITITVVDHVKNETLKKELAIVVESD